MSHSITCNLIDDCTVEVVRKGTTVIVTKQSPFVMVLNPGVLIDDCPLITYIGLSEYDVFNKVLSDMCMNNNCESYYCFDTAKHMKNGYPIKDEGQIAKAKEVAVYVYSEWKKHWSQYYRDI